MRASGSIEPASISIVTSRGSGPKLRSSTARPRQRPVGSSALRLTHGSASSRAALRGPRDRRYASASLDGTSRSRVATACNAI